MYDFDFTDNSVANIMLNLFVLLLIKCQLSFAYLVACV